VVNKPNNLVVAILGCQLKCGMPEFVRGVEICSCLQKQLHYIVMSLRRCHLQCGSPSQKCGLLYICITIQQLSYYSNMPTGGRKMECSLSIGVSKDVRIFPHLEIDFP
jgi:hypothetical protein